MFLFGLILFKMCWPFLQPIWDKIVFAFFLSHPYVCATIKMFGCLFVYWESLCFLFICSSDNFLFVCQLSFHVSVCFVFFVCLFPFYLLIFFFIFYLFVSILFVCILSFCMCLPVFCLWLIIGSCIHADFTICLVKQM